MASASVKALDIMVSPNGAPTLGAPAALASLRGPALDSAGEAPPTAGREGVESAAGMHIDPNDEALLGVTVGALLASAGGLLSGRYEQHLRRREREQSAAQL